MPAALMDLKTGLSNWAVEAQIRPVDFAKKMGYSPAYAWSLLRGKAPVTEIMLGRLALKYGMEAVKTVMELADNGKTDVANQEELECEK